MDRRTIASDISAMKISLHGWDTRDSGDGDRPPWGAGAGSARTDPVVYRALDADAPAEVRSVERRMRRLQGLKPDGSPSIGAAMSPRQRRMRNYMRSLEGGAAGANNAMLGAGEGAGAGLNRRSRAVLGAGEGAGEGLNRRSRAVLGTITDEGGAAAGAASEDLIWFPRADEGGGGDGMPSSSSAAVEAEAGDGALISFATRNSRPVGPKYDIASGRCVRRACVRGGACRGDKRGRGGAGGGSAGASRMA